MSRSRPSVGKLGSPGSDTPSTGHGFGFAWANRKKSFASAFGRMTRLACTLPGASPDVGPVNAPDRMRSRSVRPSEYPRSGKASIATSIRLSGTIITDRRAARQSPRSVVFGKADQKLTFDNTIAGLARDSGNDAIGRRGEAEHRLHGLQHDHDLAARYSHPRFGSDLGDLSGDRRDKPAAGIVFLACGGDRIGQLQPPGFAVAADCHGVGDTNDRHLLARIV